MAVEPCALDGVEDWEDWEQSGLTLQPVAYGPVWNGWAQPVVTPAEFSRFIAAWRTNDPNGTWGPVEESRDSAGRRVLVHHGTDYAPDVFAVGESGTYLIEGWTFITRQRFERAR